MKRSSQSSATAPSAISPDLARRGLTVAAALMGLGGGLWWSMRSAEAASDLPPNFWQTQFDAVSGPPVQMSAFQGRPLLINFWATWCPPCVKEIPEINHLHDAQKARGAKGCQVLGLAVDGPTPVREFLKKTPVRYPLGLAGFGGSELAQALGNTVGGLPFTVLIDAQGRVRQRKMGATTLKEMQGWLKALG
jgi:thiol-disulfide isomerase/thioredoxin